MPQGNRYSVVVASLFVVFNLVWPAQLSAAPQPRAEGKSLLEPFDYRNVTLDGGRLGAQYNEVLRDYLQVPNDDLLKSFRRRAGLPAPGNQMGGWYTSGTFCIFGQILSGLARFHAGSGDPAAKEKATYLIHEWSKTIAPDGYFFNKRRPATAHYVYEKMVGGLVDNYVYCGNEEARESLSRITDWAMDPKHLPRNHHGWNSEWYTLSENLYRAYLATGDTKYRDFAKVWEYPEYWNLYAEKRDIFSAYPEWFGKNPSYHAYSHVNTLSGAAAAFWVTGEKKYLGTITNAYDYLQTTETLTTGGYGPGEMLMKHSDLVNSLGDYYQYKHFETQCGSWAAFKLSKYLMRFTGEARYGDWIENLVNNGIGASVSMRDGKVMYCSDYHTGGATKRNTEEPWTCCVGTRSMAIADYADLIYFHDKKSIYVNLFTPSTVRWAPGRTTVTLAQQTSFPQSDFAEFRITSAKPARFGLRVRVPHWLAAPPRATINGAEVKLRMLKTGWAAVDRKWKDGDLLRVELPMALHVDRPDGEKPYPAAVLYGPVVLAVGSDASNPGDKIDLNDLAHSLIPVEGQPLHFRVAGSPSLVERPFYEFKEGEQYFMYLDPAWSNRVSPHNFTFHGKWLWGGTDEVGAWAEGVFYGDSLKWKYPQGGNAGHVAVTIDGKAAGTVDQFGRYFTSSMWERKGLGKGRHTIRFTLLAEKNPKSKGNGMSVGLLGY